MYEFDTIVGWDELSRTGVVEQINRQILHPLGLAIVCDDTGTSLGAAVVSNEVSAEVKCEALESELAAFELAWRIRGVSDEGIIPDTRSPTRSKRHDRQYVGDAAEYAWKWWRRSRALAPDSDSVSLKRYYTYDVEKDESCPLERLRAFCARSMSGRDWLDVEPFFDSVKKVMINVDALDEIMQYRSALVTAKDTAEADRRYYNADGLQTSIDAIDVCLHKLGLS